MDISKKEYYARTAAKDMQRRLREPQNNLYGSRLKIHMGCTMEGIMQSWRFHSSKFPAMHFRQC